MADTAVASDTALASPEFTLLSPLTPGEREEMTAFGVLSPDGSVSAPPGGPSARRIDRQATHAATVLNEAYHYAKAVSFSRGIRLDLGDKTLLLIWVPSDDRMQAFAYRHLVVADALRVSVSGRGGTRAPSRVLESQPLRIPVGGAARVRASLPPAYQTFEKIQFELSEPPDGITLGDTSVRGTEVTFMLQADAAKVTAGLRSNLIVLVSGERVPPESAQAPAARRRVPLGALPAISFEIVR